MSGININITSASGVRSENVSLEDAATICLNQVKNEKKWLKIENSDGTSRLVKPVDLTDGDIEQIRAMLGSATSATSVSPLVGGHDDEGRWEAEIIFNDESAPTIVADAEEGTIVINGRNPQQVEEALINIIRLAQNGLGSILKGQAVVEAAPKGCC